MYSLHRKSAPSDPAHPQLRLIRCDDRRDGRAACGRPAAPLGLHHPRPVPRTEHRPGNPGGRRRNPGRQAGDCAPLHTGRWERRNRSLESSDRRGWPGSFCALPGRRRRGVGPTGAGCSARRWRSHPWLEQHQRYTHLCHRRGRNRRASGERSDLLFARRMRKPECAGARAAEHSRHSQYAHARFGRRDRQLPFDTAQSARRVAIRCTQAPAALSQ